MKKVITFGLWGSNQVYLKGCLENIKCRDKIYPDWDIWLYFDSKVPLDFIKELYLPGVRVIIKENTRGKIEGMFWRFEAISEPEVDVMISRDLDSRLNWREKAAVDEWLASDKDFHIMRDHPQHDTVILGGMWGARNHIIPDIKFLIKQWNKFDTKGDDQRFLEHKIWPLIKHTHFTHDEGLNYNNPQQTWWGKENVHKFPKHQKMEHGSFVGEIIK